MAVNADLKQGGQPDGLEYLSAMMAGRDHGRSHSRLPGKTQKIDGIVVDRDAGLSHGGLKIRVLFVAHPIKGVLVGTVARRPERETQSSRVQEIAHAFLARLSI